MYPISKQSIILYIYCEINIVLYNNCMVLINLFYSLYENLLMNNFYKDILTAIVFMSGLFGFFSGEFIISSALFATATVASNIGAHRQQSEAGTTA